MYQRLVATIYPTPGVCEVSTNTRTKFPDKYAFLSYSVNVSNNCRFLSLSIDVANHDLPLDCDETNFHLPEQ